ncbi:cullin-like protein 3 isoform X2 [Lotus japonicus]|uniref:cullin-like protein 3 isoform X2 n=1 Tax=Lotus japonicus TaxID=34305 RepID=UPI0025836CEE|nr:cullin-like protein 3 isoform X2 [Lotus japonicus]
MNNHEHLHLTLYLFLLLLFSFNIFAADSVNMEDCKNTSQSFEERWPLLQTAVDRLNNKIEGTDNSSFTSEEYMSYYKTVYLLCTDHPLGDENSKLLYAQYKKVFQEYINATVLPSLQGKKDGLLLRELLIRWSNYKIMTRWLVHDKINKQVTDAILAMIDEEHAGEKIDRTLVNNTLAMYSEIGDILRKNNANHFIERMIKEHAASYYDEASNSIASSSFRDNTPKEEKLHDIPTPSSKKIRLVSSDGDVFEVDYGVALMSKIIEDVIKAKPAGGSDSILVSTVSSNILAKVIEYCKKHTKASNFNHKEDMSGVDIKNWDSKFVEVDYQTLFDLHMSANYLNIKSLLDLTGTTIGDMIKGKTPEEIRQMFNIKEN